MISLYPVYVCSIVATGKGNSEVTLIVPISSSQFVLSSYREIYVHTKTEGGRVVHSMTLGWCECISSRPYKYKSEEYRELVLRAKGCVIYKPLVFDRPMPKLTMWSENDDG